MNLLKNMSILLLLVGFYSPAFAAIDGFEPDNCSIYNEAEGGGENGDKKTEEEEEPDCE